MSSLSSGANPEDKVQFAVELAPDAMLRLSSEGGREEDCGVERRDPTNPCTRSNGRKI